MIYIYQDRTIRIEWSIFKGTSHEREDFSRALVKMFLIGPNEKHLIDATAFDGKLCAELPDGLPEGEYSIETIYVKNQGNLTPRRIPLTPTNATECNHHHSEYPPHDMRFNDRCIMRSRIDFAFAITSYKDEDNTSNNDVLKFRSSVASYGYDGLSAYEIAVMRGDFNGSEGEWLEYSGSLHATVDKIADNEDLSFYDVDNGKNRVLKLKDKQYDAASFSGMGRVYLRKNLQEGKNVLTQDMISEPNTRYIIQYDYDLDGGTITVPEGCILEFQGGSLDNGTLIGSNTIISAAPIKIFSDTLLLSGLFYGEGYVEYYGCYPNNEINDVCLAITKIYKGFDSIQLQNGIYYTSTGHCPITSLRGIRKHTTKIIYTASNNDDYLFSMGDIDNLTGESYRKRYLSISELNIRVESSSSTRLTGCSIVKFGNIADSSIRHLILDMYSTNLTSGGNSNLKLAITDEDVEDEFNSAIRFTGYAELMQFEDLRILGTVGIKGDSGASLDAIGLRDIIIIGGTSGYASVLFKCSVYNTTFSGYCSFNQFVYGIKCANKSVWNLSLSGLRTEQPVKVVDDNDRQLSCSFYIDAYEKQVRISLSNIHIAGDANGIYLNALGIEVDISNVFTYTNPTGFNSTIKLLYALKIGRAGSIGLITTHNVILPYSDIILNDWFVVKNSCINFYGSEFYANHSIRDAVISPQANGVKNKGFMSFANNTTLKKNGRSLKIKPNNYVEIPELKPTTWSFGISHMVVEGTAVFKDENDTILATLAFAALIDKNSQATFLYKTTNDDINYNIRFGSDSPKGERLALVVNNTAEYRHVAFHSIYTSEYTTTIEVFYEITAYSSNYTSLTQPVEWT